MQGTFAFDTFYFNKQDNKYALTLISIILINKFKPAFDIDYAANKVDIEF